MPISARRLRVRITLRAVRGLRAERIFFEKPRKRFAVFFSRRLLLGLLRLRGVFGLGFARERARAKRYARGKAETRNVS